MTPLPSLESFMTLKIVLKFFATSLEVYDPKNIYIRPIWGDSSKSGSHFQHSHGVKLCESEHDNHNNSQNRKSVKKNLIVTSVHHLKSIIQRKLYSGHSMGIQIHFSLNPITGRGDSFSVFPISLSKITQNTTTYLEVVTIYTTTPRF